ncbi:hypothetical protein BGZ72_003812 [Mortierella alpina]|nr:hypothetical protein BGZ72_003812 [Mortierella alpina]
MTPLYHHGQDFISFHDLTPRAHFLWASPSIEDCLGYTSEEIVNLSPYDLIINDDLPSTKTTHAENILNDMVASQATIRYRHKDGSSVTVLCVFSVCYEFTVNCVTVLEMDETSFKVQSAHSAAMMRLAYAQSRQEEFARIKRHHMAFKAMTWNAQDLEPEHRVCMILNRYSRSLGVLYASPLCEQLLQIEAEDIIGKPFLLFIRADDMAAFVEQANLAKSANYITHMRFWFQSPLRPQEIPCEATMFASSDGLVMIVRRCNGFFKRRRILDADSTSMESTTPRPLSTISNSSASPSYAQEMLVDQSNSECCRRYRSGSQDMLMQGSMGRIMELICHDNYKPMATIEPLADLPHKEEQNESTISLAYGGLFKMHHVQDDSD